MKKSLRQLLLVGLSATILAGVAAPAVFAQDDATEDTTEQVEEVEETEEVETTEKETEEDVTTEEETEVAAEASEVQQGVEEALSIYETEYPESVIEEIEVDLDLDETIYTIFVRGFDVDNNDYELELEWADGEVREQQFNEGWFNFGGDSEVADSEGELPSTEQGGDNAVTEMAEEEIEDPENTEPVDPVETTETEEDVDTTEDAAVEEQLDEDQARLVLNVENLLTIDEVSEIALTEAGSGEIDHWNLSADTNEWWNLFGDEENENPVWTINVVNMDDNNEEIFDGDNVEIRIDAVTGEVINPEDIEEETTAETEEVETTLEDAEVTETETELEETVEETEDTE